MLCASSHTCVYDSLHTLSVKPNKKQVSYPINVDQAAKQQKKATAKSRRRLWLVHHRICRFAVQQSRPGKSSHQSKHHAPIMRHHGQDMDITRFVNKVTTIDESMEPTILYQWTCKVYCICHMPDDGSKMVQCSKCKTWYHQKCVRGECTRNDWLCRNCPYSKRQDDAERRRFAAARQGVSLEGYRNIARKYPKQSKQSQGLFWAIAATHISYKFLETASHIGCMNKDDWLEVQKLQHCSDYIWV